ncbi:ABC transporter substrate-binding protein [Paenibacillus sp. GCM10023248]|uniref:ABC transporter substrate-binding protein n=1 Tax=unclassified Paenibacillus TaxID=185978 RepID=UPI002378F96E|nr:extracellular solute-binding protein [Paenibacillus sp. MAHUQ-63]MDD9268509.1 extracellular solute-binding protein [Paenibacillus sp. MAHUQ-63]
MKKTIIFSSKWYDHEFESVIASKLRTKFPEFMFSHVQDSGGYTSAEAWGAWEYRTDLDIRIDISDVPAFKKKDYELTPFLNNSDVKLESFIPSLLKSVSNEKRIYGLPFGVGTNYTHALFYNEHIFAKFHVPVPEHEMTWDDVITLAAKVTGTIDGIPYCGLDIGDYSLLKMQLGIRFLDPETHRLKLRDSDCNEYFRIIKVAYGIPGNVQDTDERIFVYGRAFRRNGTVAMSIDSPEMFSQKLPFKLGAVRFPKIYNHLIVPSLSDYGWFLTLHPSSEHREEAFEVISYLVSEEFQLYLSSIGRFSSLSDRKYEANYGQDNPNFSENNMEWVFQGIKKGWANPQSPYENMAGSIVRSEMERAVRGKIQWEEAIETMETRILEKLSFEMHDS